MKAPISSGRSWASEPLKARPMGVRTASTITASGMAGTLLRRHSQGAIQPDRLAVQHRVLGDLAGELRVFLGTSEPRREGHLGAQGLARLLRQARRATGCRRGQARSCRRGCRAAARSRAAGSVSPTTPPLEAEYAVWPIWPSKAAIDAVMTTAPRSPSASGSFAAIASAASRSTVAQSGQLCPDRRAAELVETGHPEGIVAYTWPGIDTTVNTLGVAVYLFATHPDQWDLVRNDPSLIPSAFAEVLRLHAPVHYFTRLTTEPVDIDGLEVPAGQRVLVMYGSANRDERHYAEPDRFDVTRNPLDQLAFGRGIHLCVGINLAKLEALAYMTALVRHVERFELVGEPQWLRNNTLHGLRRAPCDGVPRGIEGTRLRARPAATRRTGRSTGPKAAPAAPCRTRARLARTHAARTNGLRPTSRRAAPR